jgi:hypothetical protein
MHAAQTAVALLSQRDELFVDKTLLQDAL